MAEQQGITKISVQGFKSLYDKTEVDIRPLTVLAGANSSGKSSIMQPLLLMKQTLEAEYDSQALLLNGKLVNFTSTAQFMTNKASEYFNAPADFIAKIGYDLDLFVVDIEIAHTYSFELIYGSERSAFALPMFSLYSFPEKNREIRLSFIEAQTINLFEGEVDELNKLRQATEQIIDSKLEWRVSIRKGFLQLALASKSGELVPNFSDVDLRVFPVGSLKNFIQEMIYIAGFRGHPQRDYPLISSDFARFQGRFENYTASVIHHWQRSEKDEDKKRLTELGEQLKELGLAPYIAAQPLNDAQIEVRIGRTMQSIPEDTVSIADVGFGVSQVLPVLVALLVAKPGQLVYIEQPELHLHPRAQVKLAQILADAANRGVRVVVETHSSLLLLGIQTLIAEGKLNPENTILHWFTRDKEGKTKVDSQVPDENGAYGEWPEDFADVELDTQSSYLNAVARRQEQVGAE
jgi:predicted ATPase